VFVLGRPAVDRSQQGRASGASSSRDFGSAKAFYQALGFDPSPAEPMTLMVTLAGIRGDRLSRARADECFAPRRIRQFPVWRTECVLAFR
jgi:hypothetical protein